MGNKHNIDDDNQAAVTGAMCSDTAGEGTGDYQDCYRVVIKNPGLFEIKTLPPFGSTDFDSLLCVFDASGRSLLANDESAGAYS